MIIRYPTCFRSKEILESKTHTGKEMGFVGVRCASAHVATKFWRYKLAPFGIKVNIMDAGVIKTK